MTFENILLEKKNAIAYVTVNRPKVLNALNMATMEELRSAFHDIKADKSIRVVIFTGAGEKECMLLRRSDHAFEFMVEMGRAEVVGEKTIVSVEGGAKGLVISTGNPHFVEFVEQFPPQWQARAAAIGEFAAGKTGTTSNFGDAWFIGWDSKYTVAVWVGYPNSLVPMTTEFNGKPVMGGTFPALIWHDFMTAALQVDKTRAEQSAAAHPGTGNQPGAGPGGGSSESTTPSAGGAGGSAPSTGGAGKGATQGGGGKEAGGGAATPSPERAAPPSAPPTSTAGPPSSGAPATPAAPPTPSPPSSSGGGSPTGGVSPSG